ALADRAPAAPSRRSAALSLALFGLGVRPGAVGEPGVEHRFRAPTQPHAAARFRGCVCRGACAGYPAGAAAAGSDRRGQPQRPAARCDAVSPRPVALGLRESLAQFSLLVAITAFVGAMVGLERSTLPLIGHEDFGLASNAAVLSFIVAFGLAKAFTNLGAGALAQRVGRRRLLIAGWAVALPVPVLLGVAPRWAWIDAANLLLGITQGLAWSVRVGMKMDLGGPRRCR